MKSFLSLAFFLALILSTLAQVQPDSPGTAARPDSAPVVSPAQGNQGRLADSTRAARSRAGLRPPPTFDFYKDMLPTHPYYNFSGEARHLVLRTRADRGKDGLFYLLVGVLLYFSLVKLLFGKYMHNLFAVFFRVSLKQKQIREQLLQSPLPSLLLNIFFVLAGGIYTSFLLRHYAFVPDMNVWLLMLYCTIALAAIYLGKFIVLKVMGWIFNISEATDTYIFVVFLVNKFLGMALLPFIVLLAFSEASFLNTVTVLSFTLVAILFAYRYIISYAPVRKEIKVRQFHFLLYLCAFEVIPLLLIYKLLLNFFQTST